MFEIPGKGTVGMMICYDGWFPEVARGLALQGAELIAQPTATTTPDREEEIVLARSNAIVNQVFLFNPNMVSTFGPGRSVGVDPEGRILFEAGAGEELLVEVVDMARVAEVRRRGTRGVTRPWQHFLEGPRDVVLRPYRARRDHVAPEREERDGRARDDPPRGDAGRSRRGGTAASGRRTSRSTVRPSPRKSQARPSRTITVHRRPRAPVTCR